MTTLRGFATSIDVTPRQAVALAVRHVCNRVDPDAAAHLTYAWPLVRGYRSARQAVAVAMFERPTTAALICLSDFADHMGDVSAARAFARAATRKDRRWTTTPKRARSRSRERLKS